MTFKLCKSTYEGSAGSLVWVLLSLLIFVINCNVQVYVTRPQYQLLVTVNKTMTDTNNSLTSVIKYLSLAASDC